MFALIAKLLTIIAFGYLLFLKDSIDCYTRESDGWQCYDYLGYVPFKCVKAPCNGQMDQFDAFYACINAITGGSLIEIYSANDAQIAVDAVNACGQPSPYWLRAVGDETNQRYYYPTTGCTVNQLYVIPFKSGYGSDYSQTPTLYVSGNSTELQTQQNYIGANALCQVLYAPSDICPTPPSPNVTTTTTTEPPTNTTPIPTTTTEPPPTTTTPIPITTKCSRFRG